MRVGAPENTIEPVTPYDRASESLEKADDTRMRGQGGTPGGLRHAALAEQCSEFNYMLKYDEPVLS
jgi:hypothetical protein